MMHKINFLFFFIFNFSIFCIAGTISFLKKSQSSQKIDFWHLDFFKQTKLPILTGKNTIIVILDSKTSQIDSNCNKDSRFSSNFNQDEHFNDSKINTQKIKNHSAEKMKKIDRPAKFVQKNHGDCTVSIIRQLAPEVTVLSIPVLDDRGYADKVEVYQALKLAKNYNPDILHLGFQILDFDLKQQVDKKIYRLLKKFTYVIVPAGNNLEGYIYFPPKLPQVFSIASFNKKNNTHQISNFCKSINQADFIMPGENIGIKIWDQELKDYRILSVSGTSFAAALMTGFMALLFEKHNKKIAKIKADLLKLATFLDDVWENKIRYGFPHFQ